MVVKMVKRKRGSERNSKTGFEHFLEMDMKKNITAKDDLKWERKLAKKLRVKEGELWGVDDGINSLFEEIPSVVDSLGEGEILEAQKFSLGSSVKKRKKLGLVVETSSGDVALEHVSIKMCSSKKHEKELLEQGPEGEMVHMVAIRVAKPVKTFGPEVVMEKAFALEESIKYKAPYLRSCAGNELEEYHQIQRQIRGLLNRLSESNLESITKEMVTIFHSVDRSVSSQIITEEVLASCSGGQRGNEQYAAVFAAFVAGMAYLVGNDFSAELVASLAKSFEDEYLRNDELSLRNLTLLLSYLYIFNVFTRAVVFVLLFSDLIYDLLIILSKQLLEIDVSTILTILQCKPSFLYAVFSSVFLAQP
ncbi:Suppressor of glycerol defect protein 1 [Vitis vinifera]|uniref:Suppressor of glycerol defect protein 1 n=1 Tax=Vitis vinifera TaxID=29760 RepID=A0A438CTL8_VITVI|nr:Suppressor of glycerol defect protein 1 [Vitis vinifera]